MKGILLILESNFFPSHTHTKEVYILKKIEWKKKYLPKAKLFSPQTQEKIYIYMIILGFVSKIAPGLLK